MGGEAGRAGAAEAEQGASVESGPSGSTGEAAAGPSAAGGAVEAGAAGLGEERGQAEAPACAAAVPPPPPPSAAEAAASMARAGGEAADPLVELLPYFLDRWVGTCVRAALTLVHVSPGAGTPLRPASCCAMRISQWLARRLSNATRCPCPAPASATPHALTTARATKPPLWRFCTAWRGWASSESPTERYGHCAPTPLACAERVAAAQARPWLTRLRRTQRPLQQPPPPRVPLRRWAWWCSASTWTSCARCRPPTGEQLGRALAVQCAGGSLLFAYAGATSAAAAARAHALPAL